MTTVTKTGVLLLLLAGLAGCRKNPLNELTAEERRLYITHKTDGVDFGAYRSFAVAETVMLVEDNRSQSQRTPADAAFIAALTQELQGRGFQAVPRSGGPQLGIQVSRIIKTSTGVMTIGQPMGFWDPMFWGGGGVGWGPGIGWGAPPVWAMQTFEVREGILSVDVVDLKNAATNNNLRLLWNGLVRGPGLNTAADAAGIARQLLADSPYFQTR